jgi:hypothetical protein
VSIAVSPLVVEDVEARRGEQEARARARRRLEEQRAHRLSGQPSAQGGAAVGIGEQRLCALEQPLQHVARQAVEGEQVAQAAGSVELHGVRHRRE